MLVERAPQAIAQALHYPVQYWSVLLASLPSIYYIYYVETIYIVENPAYASGLVVIQAELLFTWTRSKSVTAHYCGEETYLIKTPAGHVFWEPGN